MSFAWSLLWIGGLFLLFLWFGIWEGLIRPLLPGNTFDILTGIKLLCGLVAFGVAVVMDQLECIKDLLKKGSIG